MGAFRDQVQEHDQPRGGSPHVQLPCKILLWQYSDDCHGGGGFDCDQTNPAIDLDQDLLSKCILPPP